MSPQDRYVQVILPLAVEGTFTYRVPESLVNQVAVGSRVLVSFGRKRMYAAVVRSRSAAPPEGIRPKSLSLLLDDAPVVNEHQLQLWDWMASYYMSTPGEVMRAALPSGLRPESESRIRINTGFDDAAALDPTERLLFEVVKDRGELTLREIEMTGISRNPVGILKKLVETGAVEVNEFVRSSVSRKVNRYIRVAEEHDSEEAINRLFNRIARSQRQTEILDRFLRLAAGPEPWRPGSMVLKSELTRIKGGAAALRAMINKGYLEQVEREELGPAEGVSPDGSRVPHVLNDEQQVALDRIRTRFGDHQAVLLHGITSSGKTEIYSHLIKEVLDRGDQVLYLLPEIAITAQIIERMRSIFGKRVGVYHSRYSDSERVHVYRNLLGWTDEEPYQLVIGVRSAIFLPFRSLGLIVIDEEHETTYKQHDPSPRYHARDSAQILALYHGARVLLGTATPSFETLYNARNGKYGYVSLAIRFGKVQEPELILANTREATKKKQMVSHFTPQLMEGIRSTLSRGEQVILFQNRRGYSNYLVCDDCGHVPKCSRCDVSLTFHMQSGKLECHYCGQRQQMPGACPSCRETNLKMKGFGTEKIEEEIALLFEGIRVGRLDTDTARTVRGYGRVIREFEEGRTDLLIGTQMLSKGLDFGNVGLVGVLDADSMMNFPDFRSFERSFQLISQVSGRSGRRETRGRVVIQTGDPDHPVIRHIMRNDYEGLYREQMEERELFGYPPFRRLIRISFRHRIPSILDAATELAGRELKTIFSSRVFGPQYPPVRKVQNYHIKQIILKIERDASYERARTLLRETLEDVTSNEVYRAVRISVDVDPY
jgi:primosomal protein N' (replication factor Y)